MKKSVTLSLLFAGLCSLPGFAQQKPAAAPAAPTGQTFKKKLPDDLPQSKLLFVKQTIVNLPLERPKDMPRMYYNSRKRHNEAAFEANKQLVEAVARYPFAYRITSQDSVDYYRDQGYKYKLFHSSFNAVTDGTFRGTTGHGSGASRTYTSTSVDLYVQNLTNNDQYVFDSFSETFIYYYKGIVGMLVKKVGKQFDVKK
jgi:hypothetical protein